MDGLLCEMGTLARKAVICWVALALQPLRGGTRTQTPLTPQLPKTLELSLLPVSHSST